jgi:general secretion pathway protein F
MGAFRYQAIDTHGRSVDGELSAATRAGALAELSSRGLVPLELRDVAANDVHRPTSSARPRGRWLAAFRRGRLSSAHLVQITQALGSLVRAGLMVDRALAISMNLTTEPEPRAFLEDISRRVRAGASFADSVAASGRPLPGYYVSMIAAGEAGGALATTLLRLSDLLRRQQAIRRRITSALVYPAILVSVVVLTLIVLVGFVLPRFEQLFVESEAPLPLATRVVLGFGRFVANYGIFLAIGVAAGAIALIRWLRTERGRLGMHRWMLRSRWLLGLPASIDTARLLRTLATLVGNGLTLPAALKVARGTLSNHALRSTLDAVARKVNAGEPLNAALAAEPEFPPVAAQLTRVGEETGKLDDMLLSAAEYLEEHGTTTLDRLLTLLVPALTVGMGLVVAGLIGSVLAGLLSINDLAY